jgi:hypothetical protein
MGLPVPFTSKNIPTSNAQLENSTKLFYAVNPSNWFKYFPYKFEIGTLSSSGGNQATGSREEHKEIGITKVESIYAFVTNTAKGENVSNKLVSSSFKLTHEFYLPIPPQQYSIQHIPATEATPTMGGIVEEVSYPTLFTITLSGSTGMSISGGQMGSSGSSKEGFMDVSPIVSSQRQTFDELMGISTVAGRVANAAMNSLERIGNLLTPENAVPFARGGTAVSTSDPNYPSSKDNKSGGPTADTWRHATMQEDGGWLKGLVDSITGPFAAKSKPPTLWTNGFALDHAMRQFFLIYQREKAKEVGGWRAPETALFFVDTKSNTRYRVTPRSLNFSRTADTPFTTTYSMVFRAWDLKDASASSAYNPSAVDRLSPGGDLAEAYTVNAVSLYRQMRKVEMLASNPGRAAGQLAGSAINDAKGSYFG